MSPALLFLSSFPERQPHFKPLAGLLALRTPRSRSPSTTVPWRTGEGANTGKEEGSTAQKGLN